ncbi:DUF7537 family lipoprotein [Salinigranum salinum]|uniref:DUF7537 family lipoprotein n=1 Tax=Salinigranum salinum TaxID=1364937 RepID=UPI001260AC26|nr:hypothetical protein [Salinigranum salinum]
MLGSRFLVLTIALLMVTAGCVGGGGGDAEADASGGTAGGSQSGDGGDGGSDVGADSAGNAGSDDLELADTEAALREAGSFTVVWRYSGVDQSGSETDVSREFYADLESGRTLTVISSMQDGQSDSGTMQQFFADGVTHVRSGSEESPTYFSYEQESTDVVATAIAFSQARAYGSDENMAFEGTETFDGVSVQRYELTRADSQLIRAGSAAGVAAGSSNVEITDFRYVVLVDEDGLSRFESWSFSGETTDGQTVRGEWEYSLTKVGSTTVDDPEWLAEAEAQSQG